MRQIKWWLRGLSQRFSPKFTLAALAHRTWVLEPEVALVPLLGRRNGIAVDAGANKGVYLYHLCRNYRRVIGFEPLPVLARYLQDAAPSNAVVHAMALSNAEGAATLRLPKGYNELGSLEAHTAETWTTTADVETHTVSLRTLDSFDLADVSLIKIDVEGHELAVLEGAKQTLQKWRPAVLVEVEERHSSGSVARVQSHLEAIGYSGYYLDGLILKSIDDYDVTRDQCVANLSQSVKVGRYLNNFIFFDKRLAAERVAVIRAALRQDPPLELGAALNPGHAVTARKRLAGSFRAARDVVIASVPAASLRE